MTKSRNEAVPSQMHRAVDLHFFHPLTRLSSALPLPTSEYAQGCRLVNQQAELIVAIYAL